MDVSNEMDAILHNLDFENQQFVKQIEKENYLIEALEEQVANKIAETNQLRDEISKMDEDAKRYHKQYTHNRDNLESMKKTLALLNDHEASLKNKLETDIRYYETKKKERDSTVKQYENTWEDYKNQYENFSLAKELRSIKDEEVKYQQLADEARSKLDQLNLKLEVLQKKDEKLPLERNKFVVKICETKLANLQIESSAKKTSQECSILQKEIEDLKEQHRIRQERKEEELINLQKIQISKDFDDQQERKQEQPERGCDDDHHNVMCSDPISGKLHSSQPQSVTPKLQETNKESVGKKQSSIFHQAFNNFFSKYKDPKLKPSNPSSNTVNYSTQYTPMRHDESQQISQVAASPTIKEKERVEKSQAGVFKQAYFNYTRTGREGTVDIPSYKHKDVPTLESKKQSKSFQITFPTLRTPKTPVLGQHMKHISATTPETSLKTPAKESLTRLTVLARPPSVTDALPIKQKLISPLMKPILMRADIDAENMHSLTAAKAPVNDDLKQMRQVMTQLEPIQKISVAASPKVPVLNLPEIKEKQKEVPHPKEKEVTMQENDAEKLALVRDKSIQNAIPATPEKRTQVISDMEYTSPNTTGEFFTPDGSPAGSPFNLQKHLTQIKELRKKSPGMGVVYHNSRPMFNADNEMQGDKKTRERTEENENNFGINPFFNPLFPQDENLPSLERKSLFEDMETASPKSDYATPCFTFGESSGGDVGSFFQESKTPFGVNFGDGSPSKERESGMMSLFGGGDNEAAVPEKAAPGFAFSFGKESNDSPESTSQFNLFE